MPFPPPFEGDFCFVSISVSLRRVLSIKLKRGEKKKGKKPRNQPKNETKTNNCLWGKKIEILGKKNSLRSSCRALLPSYGSCLWSSKETSLGRFSPGELCSCSESATSAAEFVQRNVKSCFKAGTCCSNRDTSEWFHGITQPCGDW